MDQDLLAQKMHAIVEAVLKTPGHTDLALRRAIFALGMRSGPPTDAQQSLPSELVPFVEKVVRYAYKVTDEDVDALRNAGYSEDAIFEVIISAAVGAGMARLESGLAVLKGS